MASIICRYIFTGTYICTDIYICVYIHIAPEASAHHTMTSTLGWTPQSNNYIHTCVYIHKDMDMEKDAYRSKYGTDIDIDICMHVCIQVRTHVQTEMCLFKLGSQ